MPIEIASLPCQLHQQHVPVHNTIEFHHLIPVAWQLFWQPAKPWPAEGKDTEGRGLLWDDRGAALCPTGHRNVHFYIVKLMRDLAAGTPDAGVPKTPTTAMARLAIERFTVVGGNPLELTAAGEWGQV